MNSCDFASDYNRLAHLPNDDTLTPYADAKRWSALFGGHLHQILSGSHPEPLPVERYIDWINTDYGDMEYELFTHRGSRNEMEIASRQLNTLSYHIFNSSLMPIWSTSHLSIDTPKEVSARKKAIVLAQGNLAVRALSLYQYRESLVKTGEYYSKDFEPLQYTIQGRLVEFDAAIALLNYMNASRPGYNLYAAPAQFEHGKNDADNVDFILTDPAENQAVGIQVKSFVKQKDFEEYDRSKVVLIDGVIDLGGERILKLPGERIAKLRRWGGMIAVSHLITMSRQDKKTYVDAAGYEEKDFLSKAFKARALMAGLKPYKAATANVGNRIEHYFNQEKAA